MPDRIYLPTKEQIDTVLNLIGNQSDSNGSASAGSLMAKLNTILNNTANTYLRTSDIYSYTKSTQSVVGTAASLTSLPSTLHELYDDPDILKLLGAMLEYVSWEGAAVDAYPTVQNIDYYFTSMNSSTTVKQVPFKTMYTHPVVIITGVTSSTPNHYIDVVITGISNKYSSSYTHGYVTFHKSDTTVDANISYTVIDLKGKALNNLTINSIT